MKTNFVKAALLAASLLVQSGVQANPVRMAARRTLFTIPKRGYQTDLYKANQAIDRLKLATGLAVGGLGSSSVYFAYGRHQANKELQALRFEVYKHGNYLKSIVEQSKNPNQSGDDAAGFLQVHVLKAREIFVNAIEEGDPAIQAAKKASEKAAEVAAQKKAELDRLTLQS